MSSLWVLLSTWISQLPSTKSVVQVHLPDMLMWARLQQHGVLMCAKDFCGCMHSEDVTLLVLSPERAKFENLNFFRKMQLLMKCSKLLKKLGTFNLKCTSPCKMVQLYCMAAGMRIWTSTTFAMPCFAPKRGPIESHQLPPCRDSLINTVTGLTTKLESGVDHRWTLNDADSPDKLCTWTSCMLVYYSL